MVTTTVLADPSSLASTFGELVAWADQLDLAYAWVTSSEGKAPHWRRLPLDKVRRAIVGTSFSQTEPQAIRALMERGVLRVVDGPGVFHPKLVLATKGGLVRAVIGSSNFTSGGFGVNIELNVLLSGRTTDPEMVKLTSFIEHHWSGSHSFVPDEPWLAAYEKLWQERPRIQAPLRRPAPPRAASGRARSKPGGRYVEDASELNLSWPEYVKLIEKCHGRPLGRNHRVYVFDHDEGSYLEEAEACQRAFQRHPRFASMPLKDRQRVAGWGPETTGHYGRMGGAGTFKGLTAKKPEVLGRYLDRVPLEGPISIRDVRRYLDGICSVNGIGLGTATRLLSMKRPDLFISANNASFANLKRVFGKKPSTIDKYVELTERVWRLPWAQAPLPSSAKERRIWRARVALLDALVYEPV